MILSPPSEFDYPYLGQYLEQRLSWEELNKICGYNTLACMKDTFIKNNICVIFMPLIGKGGVSQRTYELLKSHENAHCNGWRHVH